MREWQSQSHVRWYCRYHVVWVPKYRKLGDLRRDATWDWENRSGAVSAAGRGVGRRARAVGSRACVVGHPAEVQRGEHGGVSEREVGDPHPSGVSGAATQLHGLPLLGARVLRQHGRFGRRGHPRLHPEAGSRGKGNGSIRVSQRHFGAFWGFAWVIRWESPCGSSWKTRSVFQGAVGAFGASTVPSASTGARPCATR